MSAHAMSWAFGLRLSVTDKVVLLAMANHANGDGEFHLSEAVRAQVRSDTGLGERAIDGAIHSLADKGLLRGARWSAGGGWAETDIRLNLGAEAGRPLQLARAA
jgi:hypothetical protein